MESTTLPSDATARTVVRHLVATLAYRAAKVLRDIPAGFGQASFGEVTRTPVSIVAHMGDLIAWAISVARGGFVWKPEGSGDWNAEVTRFFDNLAALDRELASNAADGSIEKLIQDYTRESGVRELDRQLASIMRYQAKQLIMKGKIKPTVTADDIEKMLGKTGLIAVRKFFGVILLAIAVKIFGTNVQAFSK